MRSPSISRHRQGWLLSIRRRENFNPKSEITSRRSRFSRRRCSSEPAGTAPLGDASEIDAGGRELLKS